MEATAANQRRRSDQDELLSLPPLVSCDVGRRSSFATDLATVARAADLRSLAPSSFLPRSLSLPRFFLQSPLSFVLSSLPPSSPPSESEAQTFFTHAAVAASLPSLSPSFQLVCRRRKSLCGRLSGAAAAEAAAGEAERGNVPCEMMNMR